MADEKSGAADLRSELNSLWKTTLDQFDEIKDVIVKSSSAGKVKLDSTILKRERDRLLTRLGTLTLEALEAGTITAPPGAEELLTKISAKTEELREMEKEFDSLVKVPAEPPQADTPATPA